MNTCYCIYCPRVWVWEWPTTVNAWHSDCERWGLMLPITGSSQKTSWNNHVCKAHKCSDKAIFYHSSQIKKFQNAASSWTLRGGVNVMNTFEKEAIAEITTPFTSARYTDSCFLLFFLLFMSITKIFWCFYLEISIFFHQTDDRWQTDKHWLLNTASCMRVQGKNNMRILWFYWYLKCTKLIFLL